MGFLGRRGGPGEAHREGAVSARGQDEGIGRRVRAVGTLVRECYRGRQARDRPEPAGVGQVRKAVPGGGEVSTAPGLLIERALYPVVPAREIRKWGRDEGRARRPDAGRRKPCVRIACASETCLFFVICEFKPIK